MYWYERHRSRNRVPAPQRRRQRGRPPHPDVLTPAEWRVLELIREGRSNPEIAARLGVSVNTVKTQVSSMLSKLALSDRAELATWDGAPVEASRSILARFSLAAPFGWLRELIVSPVAGKTVLVGGLAALSIAAVAGLASVNAGGGGVPASAPPGAATPEPEPTSAAGANLAVCLQGDVYIADGPIALATATAGDADRIGALRWAEHEGCERFVIDVVAEDGSAAGSVGRVEAEVLRSRGVVRVHLLDVEWVEEDATDATFGGALAGAAYAVVSAQGGSTYVDLHFADAAEASVSVLDDRVVVDLRPGGGPVPGPAVTNSRVVVLEPRPDSRAYPLTVTGYARTFEANVVVRLEQDGQEVFQDFTTATAWAESWGHFSLIIEDGPSGVIQLHVGEHEAAGGVWEGIVIELEMTNPSTARAPAAPGNVVISGALPDLDTPIAPGEGETGRVSIQWRDRSDDEDGFRIYVEDCEGGRAALLEVPSDETSYGPLNPCRPARVGVAAFNAYGESAIVWGEPAGVS